MDLAARREAFSTWGNEEAAAASGWTPVTARDATDRHKRGDFVQSWQLGIDALSDWFVYGAFRQRVSVPMALPYEVEGPARAPGRYDVEAAAELWREQIARLLWDTLRDLCFFGFSVWQHPREVDDAGRTYFPKVERWSIPSVSWWQGSADEPAGYYAQTRENGYERLPKPGTTDGHWTVLGEGSQPHLHGAIVALDMLVTKHLLGARAEGNLVKTAGEAAVYGVCSEKYSPGDAVGEATQKAINGLGRDKARALLPYGTTIETAELRSSNDQTLFDRVEAGALQAIGMVICGQGATLAGTSPGVYANPRFFDVIESLIQEDVTRIKRAADGLFAVMAQENQGPGAVAPSLKPNLLDQDQADRAKAFGERLAAYHLAVQTEGLRAGNPEDEERNKWLAAQFSDGKTSIVPMRLPGAAMPAAPPGGVPPPAAPA